MEWLSSSKKDPGDDHVLSLSILNGKIMRHPIRVPDGHDQQSNPLYLLSTDSPLSYQDTLSAPREYHSLYSQCHIFDYGKYIGSPGSSSSLDPFPIKSRAKQGCILAPTLFGIFFLLLSSAFNQSKDGIYTWSDRNLFNLSHLRAKSIVLLAEGADLHHLII